MADTPLSLEPAVLSFAGQVHAFAESAGAVPARVDLAVQTISCAVGFVVEGALLSCAGQQATPTWVVPLAPGAIHVSGQEIMLPLSVTPATLSIAGQDVPLRLLARSRILSALKLPRRDDVSSRRLPTYWKGVRSNG